MLSPRLLLRETHVDCLWEMQKGPENIPMPACKLLSQYGFTAALFRGALSPQHLTLWAGLVTCVHQEGLIGWSLGQSWAWALGSFTVFSPDDLGTLQR